MFLVVLVKWKPSTFMVVCLFVEGAHCVGVLLSVPEASGWSL